MKDDKSGRESEDESQATNSQVTPAERGKNYEKGKPKKFIFFVGQQRFETTEQVLTAAQIKAYVSGVEPGDKLSLEGKGDEPDRLLQDDEQVNLDEERGPLRFTIVPSASFGA